MKKELTSTEVVRRFGDILAEVKHGGHTVVVLRNGVPVAEIQPVAAEKTFTVGEFLRWWRENPTDLDGAFADDLEQVNQSDAPLSNPWE